MKRIAVLLIVLGVGCDTALVDDLDFDGSGQVPVITGALVPGFQPRVRLSFSNSILVDQPYSFITNALVIIDHTQGSDTLFHDLDGVYLGDFDVEEGVTYSIQAEIPGYGELVADDFVPHSVDITSLTYQPSISEGQFGNITSRLQIDFEDDPDQKNYYEVIVYQIREEGVVDMLPIRSSNVSIENYENQAIFTTDATDYLNVFLISDELFNGELFVLDLEHLSPNDDPIFVDIKSLTPTYYRYLLDMEKVRDSQGSLFTEAVTVESNVTGGFGIFTCFSLTTANLR